MYNSISKPRILQFIRQFLSVISSIFLLTYIPLYSQVITDESFNEWRNTDPTIITELLKDMPKGGELHSHLSGAIHFDDLFKIAVKHNYRVVIDKDTIGFVLPFNVRDKPKRPTRLQQKCLRDPSNCFLLKNLTDDKKQKLESAVIIDQNDVKSTEEHSYKSFGDIFSALDDLTDNADLIPKLVKQAMKDASSHNISYLELKLSPYGRSDSKGQPVKIETLLDNISSAIDEQNNEFISSNQSQVITKFIAQIKRSDPLSPGGITDLEPVKCTKDCYLRKQQGYLHSRLRQAYYLATLSRFNNLVIGIDFVGLPEQELSTKPGMDYLLGSLRAEFGDVNMTIHAGESNRPGWYDHVSEAVNLGAQRIGHGVNLVNDMESWDLICRKGTPIEINLTSNVLLGVVNKLEDHPFPLLFNKKSCAVPKTENGEQSNDPVTLNTDNAGIFQTDMSNEFCIAATSFELSWEEIKQLARNSLKYSFVPPETRRILLENLDQEILNFERNWQPRSKNFNCRYP